MRTSFHGAAETRSHIVRDKVAWKGAFRQLPGPLWSTAYGQFLRPLFDAACPTTFAVVGKGIVRGMELFTFTFHASEDSCFGQFLAKYEGYYPARSGRIFVDAATGQLMQLDVKMDDVPKSFPAARDEVEVSWTRVKIGDATPVLPVSIDQMVQGADGTLFWIRMEESNHRQFEAASKITFN
jgi:hypothetical protein